MSITTIQPRQLDLRTDKGQSICWEENLDLGVTIAAGVKALGGYVPSGQGLVLVSLVTDGDDELIEVQTYAESAMDSLATVERAIAALTNVRDGLKAVAA